MQRQRQRFEIIWPSFVIWIGDCCGEGENNCTDKREIGFGFSPFC